MSRDTRYDILFEPVQIGPVTTKNRFYQVPHCNGGGYRDPSAVAAMRRVKAEGGWGVVFTEQVEMHHSSVITPFIELHLWDDDDVPMLAKMASAIHEFDTLAGIQLAYSGVNGPNLYTREVPLAPKPVVGVGRFTSPDVMVKQVKSGTLDLIGCARPSIADPFLPRKIDEGRVEDIRECIGCNICITGDMTMSISRCTQNPTFMEEWRKGWHPEEMQAKGDSESVLIVGAGPAGLEAAHALGKRGYQVVLAEAKTELGGRVARERQLPGLSAWGRVADYREYQLSQMPNVDIYLDNELSADDILEFGFEHVVLATGSRSGRTCSTRSCSGSLTCSRVRREDLRSTGSPIMPVITLRSKKNTCAS